MTDAALMRQRMQAAPAPATTAASPTTRMARTMQQSGGSQATPTRTIPQAEWPLSVTNEASKFRSLLMMDRIISAGESVTYSPEEYSDILGRPDFLHSITMFTQVTGATPQVSVTFETSFDGVHYAVLFSTGTFPITSGMIIPGYSTGFPLANALIRGTATMISGSARLRAWNTSLMRGRRRFGVMALDKSIEGTGNYYSATEYNDMFGTVDKLAMLVLADSVSGTGVTLTVQIEESADGAEWVNKSATPEVNAVTIPVVDGIPFEDRGGVPSANLVRLRVSLAGTTPAAAVKIFVVGRGQ